MRPLIGLTTCVETAAWGPWKRPAALPPVSDVDAAEIALVDATLHLDLPLLGICRGFQVLNVARGGDLVQHLPLGVQWHPEEEPEPAPVAALVEAARRLRVR